MTGAALEPVVDELWGRASLAYHLQPGFAAAGQAVLEDLQRRAAAAWPHALRLPPAGALHVTIYALVPVRGSFDKEAYWSSVRERALALAREAAAAPFALRFRGIRVRADAVIAVAEDPSGTVARLREAVAALLPPPPGLRPLHYDLIHCTLARHASTAPVLPAAVEAVEAIPVDARAPVERIRIVRETAYPCLAFEEVAAVPLEERRSGAGGAPARDP